MGSENLPSMWEPGGTANRILGEEAAKQTSKRDAATRRADIQKKLQSGAHISNKKRQQLKKAERKLANEERKRSEQQSGDGRDYSGGEGAEIHTPPNLQSL